jgi:hypothetical protein
MNLSEFINLPQFSLDKEKKSIYLIEIINELHNYHFNHSIEYKKITEQFFNNQGNIQRLEDMPFLPVSLFKTQLLKSVDEKDIYKILTSSGTTGQIPSRIVLDKTTANFQSIALSKIMTHVIGNERIPMLIVDSKSVLKDRNSYSARGAGIIGLSVFGKNHFYLLNEEFQPDLNNLRKFVENFNGKRILIFGFTFLIWQYLVKNELGIELDFSNAILIHSGGWKKLQELAVDNSIFKNLLFKKFGIQKENIYNFYGMVEQVGSIFLENSDEYLHCPNFSEIIIRNPEDFSVQPIGKEGLIQVISVLPRSYPGHSLLTEDIGICLGEDDASNGWKGKYFKLVGRAKKAEPRGCSDTFTQ